MCEREPEESTQNTPYRLDELPLFTDRWRVLAVVAVIFAQQARFLGESRSLVLWFDRDGERFLFESILAGVKADACVDYVDEYVKLRIVGEPVDGHEVGFTRFLTCVGQLISGYGATGTGSTVPEKPPGLFEDSDDGWGFSSTSSCDSVPGEEDYEFSVMEADNRREAWVFIDSEIDLRSMCPRENMRLISLRTQPEGIFAV